MLGIDPGSRVTGYAVVRTGARGTCAYVECGVIEARKTAALAGRLAEIARDLREVVDEFSPDEVAVEDVFSHHNPRSALMLAHARGTVFAVAGMAGVKVCSYPPAVVKKTVTGRGRAPKEQVARMAAALVGLRTPPRPDAADALAVAIAHALTLGVA